MPIIEACARAAAIAVSLLLALILLRDARRIAVARYAGLFCLGGAAILIGYASPFVTDPAPWLAPIRLLAFGNPALFWVVASAVFDDDFSLSWMHGAAWFALTVLGFWAVYGPAGLSSYLPDNLLSLACVLLALSRGLIGRTEDLVEARRRFRVIFVVASGLFTTSILVSVILLHGGGRYPAFGLVEAFGTLALDLIAAAALLSLTPGALFEAAAVAAPRRAAPEKPVADAAPEDPREAALLAALRRELEDNRAYREAALSIAALASRLGAPEYRLRRLINQRLGYRNFNAFLNGYRLDEAAAALADPTQAGVPILTIGLDAGFQSVTSFNRAFKAKTGVTPSAYREQHLGG